MFTTYTMSQDVITENVFKVLLARRLIKSVLVKEAHPGKGKPAMRKDTQFVWTIYFEFEDRIASPLQSARGGIREWASLDRLTRWLRSRGITHFSIILNESN